MSDHKPGGNEWLSKSQLVSITVIVVAATIAFFYMRGERLEQEHQNDVVSERLNSTDAAAAANAETLETVNSALAELCDKTTAKEQMESGVRYTCKLQKQGETDPIEPDDEDQSPLPEDDDSSSTPDVTYTLDQLRSIAASQVAKAIKANLPEDGVKGDQGKPGKPGKDGEPGDAGASAYELAVANGFTGSRSEWLASLEGAMGIQGIQGPKGDTGAVGPVGKSAYEIAVEQGFVGTRDQWLASLQGADGKPGPAGKSAYEIAQENGFVGTREQWLASLQGPKGEKGDKGDKGEPGDPAELPARFIIDVTCSSNDQIIVSYYGGTYRYITIADPITGRRMGCTATGIL